MKGPPFSVPDSDVHKLLGPYFEVEQLAHSSGPDRLGNLADRGLDTMEEHVYRITRKT
jgi:thiopurine S-methyltransferase